MSSGNTKRRIETDVMKLLMSDHDVRLVNDNMQEFYVKFHGPKDTPYEGGVWRLHVELPDNYPYKSPSIGFVNKIFHPNIDIASGSICLDVINSTWSPLYDLLNIIEWMIPGLLKEPNGSDPLNNEAAGLQLHDKKIYEEKIKEYIDKYATLAKYKARFCTGSDSDDDEEDREGVDDSAEEEKESATVLAQHNGNVDSRYEASDDEISDVHSDELSDIAVSSDEEFE
ncbi:hypothetical protein TPHA_0O00920 [Tetrapisispora phaffii CBS 4417]|uniref:UBC core domain-containing protein n=1 Tax=Tetrapisispora phaffii (strain ATCC 24235 / CBS 4417 / NBRC 1672 / NRRL Y-8282 / UCD 70-5) TaxID=1071381 RepID=G8C1N3_TETPH|nr:hypothetical protein TPHA_0O00920 [Tetrapisispora phaffii CBS 4417]CCE66061.1 hypothetical protein TPHA_0O00920 [Tetrapisispora phaffii CBS 4417]